MWFRMYPDNVEQLIIVMMKLIKKLLAFFWSLQAFRVSGNVKFKDIHKGETCLIFGNGASLKYFDFNAIPQTVAISCAFGLLDKRLQKLNVKYSFFSDSYMFYPIIYNDYAHVNSFQKNYIQFLKTCQVSRKVRFHTLHINPRVSMYNLGLFGCGRTAM